MRLRTVSTPLSLHDALPICSFLSYVESYPKPVVGAVNGTAVGGGLELLLVLDIVVASSEARFGQTELNVGLIPGRSEEHTSELQSQFHIVCRLLLEKKNPQA